MAVSKYTLTNAQFHALREKLKQNVKRSAEFDQNNIDAAYAVMVLGESVANVALKSGNSRQNLHRVLRDLWAIFIGLEPPSRILQRQAKRKEHIDKNWVRVTVTVPPELAKKIYALAEKAQAQWDAEHTVNE